MKVEIIEQDINGNGVAKVNNIPIFVKKSLKGELVEIEIEQEKKNYKTARITKIIKEAPDRVIPTCKYYNECGGCNLLHQNYNDQLNFKKEKVIKNLKKIANISIENPTINYGNQFNYRNKITLHSNNKEVGLYKQQSKDIIKIDECLLVDTKINEELKNIKPTNKDIVIRSSAKEIVIDDKIIKQIGDYKFIVRRNSFFQINDTITEKLYNKIKDVLKEEKNSTVLDLYCGSGTIGIYIANNVKKVIGIEINESSIEDAKENIKLNNIKNAEFILGDVSNQVSKVNKADIVIVDPPRKGLTKETITKIKEVNPKKIIYISCDSATLARDLKEFRENYNINTIELFDMFPNTKHIETLVEIIKK